MLQLIDQSEMVGASAYKEIMKSYKYELEPTKKQEIILNKTIGICRHLYNIGLEQRKDAYENGQWYINCYEQINQLPELKKKDKEFQDVYTDILQDVIRRLDKTYRNFFRRVKKNKTDSGKKEKAGFPRFKGYGRYNSFTFPQYGNGCDIRGTNNDIIRLSKIGEIKFIKHRNIGNHGIPYQIKTITIKKEIDKYFVVFTIETFVEIQIPSVPKEMKNLDELDNKCIGIDMGLDNLVMLSTRQKIDPQKYLRKSEKRLAIEQRKLSKKLRYEKEIVDERESKKQKKDVKKKIRVNSKNREKQRIKVAKIHRKIANQRRNFNHNISRTLISNFDLIVFEKLNIQQMTSNHRYAKSIADASWYQIQMFTKYKAEWAGKLVDFVEAKNTTKECSKCGKINDMPIWKRTMECSCGNIEDRDIDASLVIRDRSAIYQDLKRNMLERNKELEKISRDAMSRIQTSGEETSTQSNEQVFSVNQETSPNAKGGNLTDTILQAPPHDQL